MFGCTWQRCAHANSSKHGQGSPTGAITRFHQLPVWAHPDPSGLHGRHMPVPRMLPGPASITALFHRHQVFIMGKEELSWFSPNFEIFKPWGWMNQKLRIFFVVAVLFFPFYSLFFLQTGCIFKTCHPQTVWNTEVSALFLSTDIIWNHLKGQIICPLISQTARVDIFGSF